MWKNRFKNASQMNFIGETEIKVTYKKHNSWQLIKHLSLKQTKKLLELSVIDVCSLTASETRVEE